MIQIAKKKRIEALKNIKIDKEPYHVTPIERKFDEYHPFVYLHGHAQIPVDDDGILPAGFDREYYEIKTLALLDTRNDVTIVTKKYYLGLELPDPTRVYFIFE